MALSLLSESVSVVVSVEIDPNGFAVGQGDEMIEGEEGGLIVAPSIASEEGAVDFSLRKEVLRSSGELVGVEDHPHADVLYSGLKDDVVAGIVSLGDEDGLPPGLEVHERTAHLADQRPAAGSTA